jgi:hypothetical protein
VTLSVQRYIATIVDEAEALTDAASRDLTAQVPSCPDWSAADLVYHIGDVYWSWRAVVEQRRTESSPPRPRGAGRETV